jgi:hypothetical protein
MGYQPKTRGGHVGVGLVATILGLFVFYLGASNMGDGWRAAHGQGKIPGVFTLTSCSKHCYGDFVSTDGRVRRPHMTFTGDLPDGAPAGTRVPASIFGAGSSDAYQSGGPWWMWGRWLPVALFGLVCMGTGVTKGFRAL